jgi:branched-chain amino acid transport system substrate-binding protein
MQRGAEIAAADLNSAGGVLGEQVRLVVADDFCDPKQAVAAAKKLVDDHVVVVIGHSCSGASIPASEIYEKAGVLQISPGSTNPMLTDAGRANVFRVIGRDDAQGMVAADYLAKEWAGRKVAILHDNTTYGKGLAEETRAQLNRRGVREAHFDAFVPGKSDYSSEVGALQAADISVLYVGGYPSEVALMARAARDRNYSLQLVSGDALSTEEFALIAGPAAEGTRFTFIVDPRRNAEAGPVVERFRAEGYEPAGYTLTTYAAVQAWAQAVGKASSLELAKVIATLKRDEFDTVLGRIGFDQKGDLKVQRWVWYIWRGGEYVPAEQD